MNSFSQILNYSLLANSMMRSHTTQPLRPRGPTTWNSLWMIYLATTMRQYQFRRSTKRQARLAWKAGCLRPPVNTSTRTPPRCLSRRHMNPQRLPTISKTSRHTLPSLRLSHRTCGFTLPLNGYPQHPSYTSFDFEHANTTHTFGTRHTAHPSRRKKQQHWMSTSATMINNNSSRDIMRPWANVRSSRPSSLPRAQAASSHQHRKRSKLKHCPQLSAAHSTLRAPY